VNAYPLFRWLLFRLNPEVAHRLTLRVLHTAGNIQPISTLLNSIYASPSHPIRAFGLDFSNPIGLAAGYDKDGIAWRGMACLGFSHIEIGTVTPHAQSGNPKPRLFRLPEERALINRLGFPGSGADFVLSQISIPRPKNLVLGVNIGKNKDTPLQETIWDYLSLLRLFAYHADYLTINVSSPNTVGLRQLQEHQALDQLLKHINEERKSLKEAVPHRRIPILVKLSPDLSDAQLNDALEVIIVNEMDGIIATNTTTSRQGILSPLAGEDGGLSGKPLFNRSLLMVEKIQKITQGSLPVVGAGGIDNAASAYRMMEAGATLLQVYTGLVYQGPGIVKRILQDL
jgi:dihydroorotate dehydrogenase